MSKPIRYDVGMTTEFNPHGFNHSFPRVYEAEQGKYVEYADYTRLKAEVERLTKAGDAMAEELIRLEAAFNNIESAEAQMWYIAKEGGCP